MENGKQLHDDRLDGDDNCPSVCAELPDYVGQIRTLKEQHASLKRKNVFLSVLSQTILQLMHQKTLSQLLQHIADQIVEQTGSSGAYIHMVHETGERLDIVAATGCLKENLVGMSRKRGEGMAGICWETGKLQFTPDYLADNACVLDVTETFQACAIPLSSAGKIDGVVGVSASMDAGDLRLQLDMLEEIAQIASAAIWRTRQTEAIALELKRTNALSKLSDLFSHATQLDQVVSEMCSIVIDIFEVERVDIIQIKPGGEMCLRDDWGKSRVNGSGDLALTPELLERSICRWTTDHKVHGFISRRKLDVRESVQMQVFRKKMDLGCAVSIPVTSGSENLGVLHLCRSKDKRDFDANDINSFMSIAGQISAAIERMRLLDKIKHQATHDMLTQIPNRRHFEQTLSSLIVSSDVLVDKAAVVYLDLDGFKYINDTHGHSIGDEVLRSVTERLADALGENCFLARMGGDEFAAIIRDVDNTRTATKVVDRLIASLSEPVNVRGFQLKIGASAGISLFPQDGVATSVLLDKADEAMYQAKRQGAGSVQVFNGALAKAARRRAQLQLDLKKAIHEKQFHLVYQPKVCMEDGQVHSVEALIRWNHPERGLISPKEFIGVAEDTGLISQLGNWVLEEACKKIVTWEQEGNRPIKVAINVSSAQFMMADFVDQVIAMLARYDVSTHCLELELTESVVMYDIESVVASLKRLRRAGVRIAIDDFGTGYSSLSYLRDLPVDVLKIDRAFLAQLDGINDRKSLVNIIILMAAGLGLETVVEGVEESGELEFVSRLGCDFVQGYYYSKPVNASELPSVIARIEKKTERLCKVC